MGEKFTDDDKNLARVTQELAQSEEETDESLDMIRDLVVETEEDRKFVATLLADVASNEKKLEEKRTWLTGPMVEALERSRVLFRPSLKALKEMKKILKSKLKESIEKHQRQQEEALEEAAAEGSLVRIEAASKQVSVPEGIQTRVTWKFRVDESKLPMEYMMVDEEKIDAVVRVLKGDTDIPGVEAYPDTTIAVVGKR